MDSLEGRVAIVTGASRGIGQAIARRFASGGAAMAITARTAEEGQHRLAGSLATTAADISQAGDLNSWTKFHQALWLRKGRIIRELHDCSWARDICQESLVMIGTVPDEQPDR